LSSVTELFSDAENAFFERIMTNSEHVLQPLNRSYLRNQICHTTSENVRTHNRSLISRKP